jgi:hypothetical protein
METVRNERKKAGRPVKAIKKEVRACVRFSRHEYFIVQEKASQAGLNASEYIRQITVTARILPRISREEAGYIRQLIGMSTNINQVAKICHREGLFEALVYFEKYRSRIDHLLKMLKQ